VEVWATALKEKLDEWKALKATGMLDKLGEEEAVSEDLLEEIEEESKRLRRKRRGDAAGENVQNDGQKDGCMSVDQAVYKLEGKFKTVGGRRGSSLGVYNLLVEMRDKGTLPEDLIHRAGMALARLDSDKLAWNGYRVLRDWHATGAVVFPAGFFAEFANSCLSRMAMYGTGAKVVADLEAAGEVGEGDFAVGHMCAELHALETDSLSTDARAFSLRLREWLADDAALAMAGVRDLNMLVRVLGKYKRVDDIFLVLARMRSCGNAAICPDDESLEFLGNALVSSVGQMHKAKAMKDLPSPDVSLPEVVFTGRSNVGKSSLVNMLCNRKALASTSATPGHTSQFHFFLVNEGVPSLPSFYLVDVPGLGYAEADEGRQTSWRSLLERYLMVRSSLGVVFHLVDSRHGLTDTDRMQLDIARRAVVARRAAGEACFEYCVVLTKVDKAGAKAIKKTLREVKEGTTALAELLDSAVGEGGGGGMRVLQSSSVDRQGREDMLRLLYDSVGGTTATATAAATTATAGTGTEEKNGVYEGEW
jgi:GTP-binding protein